MGRLGIEPRTYGLKERSGFQAPRGVEVDRGRLVGLAAATLLDAAERGVVERAAAEALAREWLALTGGDVALAVLEGDDEHVAARVVELCGQVLSTLEPRDGLLSAGTDTTKPG